MRRESRRQRGTVLLLMSPWIVGFLVFLRLSDARHALLLVHPLRPAHPAGVGRASNYRFMFTSDPHFWQSLRNTLWIIAGAASRCRSSSPSAPRWSSTAAEARRRHLPDDLLPPVDGPGRLPRPWGSCSCSTRRPDRPRPARLCTSRSPCGSRTRSGPSRAWCCWACGRSATRWSSSSPACWTCRAQLYEAADIEGASAWQRFRYVTLPMISPVIFFAIVTGVIYGFQYFTEAFVAVGRDRSSLGRPPGVAALLHDLALRAGLHRLPPGLRARRWRGCCS